MARHTDKLHLPSYSLDQWTGRNNFQSRRPWYWMLRRRRSQLLMWFTAALSVWRLCGSPCLWPRDPSDGVPASLSAEAGVNATPLNLETRQLETQAPLAPEERLKDAHDVFSLHDPPWFPIEAFPPYESYARTQEIGDMLPDMVFTGFEDAVKDMELEGWEDRWISKAKYNETQWGVFSEQKIDFVYTWVNGSEEAFRTTKDSYAGNSTLKDEIKANSGTNRYRDWEELRYSIRSLEMYAPFKNKVQVLVNSVKNNVTQKVHKQMPGWLSRKKKVQEAVQVLSQEEFFSEDKRGCLPSFNSLTMEGQIYNTPSNVDRVFAMSDDMLLGKTHAASDMYSPLFGTMMSFKSNSYNTRRPPDVTDAHRFGEKPWLIYTSWLLNRRFGERKRKGQTHFGKSLSRSVMSEALSSFPGPNMQSACSRFRGDIEDGDLSGFQIYPWYLYFHYTIERHREALLWSYFVLRSDVDGNGFLSADERQTVLEELAEGMNNSQTQSYRFRNYYHLSQVLESAGIEAPKVNTEILWTSADGPVMIKDADCVEFDVNECLAHGFTATDGDGTSKRHPNPFFSTSVLFERVAFQNPTCGDCILKLLLHRQKTGFEPLLPPKSTRAADREVIVKALIKYQYTIVEPDALFVMVTDAEQIEQTLIPRFVTKGRRVGQLCLNDDVTTEDEQQLDDMMTAMGTLYKGMFPKASPYEKTHWP